MNIVLNNERFEDYFDHDSFIKEGDSELKRRYVKNESYTTTKSEAPIAARGITAFLSGDEITSFRQSLPPHKGLNVGIGVQIFFEKYLDHCITMLMKNERLRTPFEDERKSKTELIFTHLETEDKYYNTSKLIFEEVREMEIKTIAIIKKASLRYPEWVKNTYLDDKIKTIEDIQKLPNDSLFNEDPVIFVPKFNEDIIDDLYEKLGSYFVPQERFKNFLIGNHIEEKINFTGNQNMLAGIFILSKEYSYVTLGTHQQTFDFIKQTFLIKGNQIVTKQILSYLGEPGSVDKFGNLKDQNKPGKANRKTFIDISI